DLNRTRRAEHDIVRQGEEGSLGHCLARHKKHDDERLAALFQPRLGLDGRAHAYFAIPGRRARAIQPEVSDQESSQLTRPGTRRPFTSLALLENASGNQVPGIADEFESFFNTWSADTWIEPYFFGCDNLPGCDLFWRRNVMTMREFRVGSGNLVFGTAKREDTSLNNVLAALLTAFRARYKVLAFEKHKLEPEFPNCAASRGSSEKRCRCRGEDVPEIFAALMPPMVDIPSIEHYDWTQQFRSYDAIKRVLREYLNLAASEDDVGGLSGEYGYNNQLVRH
ncbi:hypothetical protein C8Q76DRAFT_761668, partial [Earliella scabrosa]